MSTYARNVTLSLGLVTTKVKLETVKNGSKREETAFKNGHDCGDGKYNPINMKKWCDTCDVEVTEPVKLRAVDGGWAAFDAEEVKELRSESISVDKGKISLTQHDTVDVTRHTQPSGMSYYIYSDVTGNDEALAAIRDYVATHPDKTLMSVVCLREGSEHLARLNLMNDHLVLEMLLWPDAINAPRPDENSCRDGMVDLLEKIAATVEEKFDADAYRSSFGELVAEAEKAKVPGEGGLDMSQMPKKVAKKTTGMDLMAAMQAYVEALPQDKPKRKK